MESTDSTIRPSPSAFVPWDGIDTVLVDMDGTLLDLAFDNFFWLELVPLHYAKQNRLNEAEAREEVMARYRELEGSLRWYCIDHWTENLGLDIRALKWQHRRRIRYHPNATAFLSTARRRGKRLLLVTNAHRASLAIKIEQTGLDREVHGLVSSHDFSVPKESQEFWAKLQSEEDFNPERTLLIEDSVSVLQAASSFGIKFMIAVRRPDSSRPPRHIDGFPAVNGIHELV